VAAAGGFELFVDEFREIGDFAEVEIANFVEQWDDAGIGGVFQSPCEFADIEFESDAEGIFAAFGGVAGLIDKTEGAFEFIVTASDGGSCDEEIAGLWAKGFGTAGDEDIERVFERQAGPGDGGSGDDCEELFVGEFGEWET
jgi:hypothetical protein